MTPPPSSIPPPVAAFAASPLFISSRVVCRIVDAAKKRGVDGDELCHSVDIDPQEVYDIEGRIDIACYHRLWAAAVAAVGDPRFAFAVAETWSSTHNLLRFICMSSANLGEALERASRYLRVLTNAVAWPLEWREDRMVLLMLRHDDARQPELALPEAFGAAEIVTLARAFTGTAWDPIEIRLTPPEPDHAEAYRAFFRAPVTFGCERAEVHVARDTLRLPLVKADPATVAFFEPFIEKMLRSDVAARSLVERVKQAISDGLRGDTPTLEKIATKLSTSGRTLRRRLNTEGHTFQGLLDERRASLAKQHIASGLVSLPEISFLLGFSEPSAFHRAFRRWTGTTPQSYARALRAGVSAPS